MAGPSVYSEKKSSEIPQSPQHNRAMTKSSERMTKDLRGVEALYRLFSYAKHEWKPLISSASLVVASSLFIMASSQTLGRYVDFLAGKNLAQTSHTTSIVSALGDVSLYTFGLLILTYELMAVVLQYFGRVGLARTTNAIALYVRSLLFQKLNRLPISFYDQEPAGRTLTRLTNDVEGIEDFFSGTLAKLMNAAVNICTVFLGMLLISPRFGFIVVLASLPCLIFTFAFNAPIRFWLRTYKRQSAQSNAFLAEFLSGLSVIKIFGLERWSQNIFADRVQELRKAGLSLLWWNSLIRPAALFLCALPVMVIVFYGGQHVLAGELSVGIVVAFVRLSERFTSPIRVVSQEIQVIQEALASSERVVQMLEEDEEESSIITAPITDADTIAQRITGTVSFQDVWMSYPTREEKSKTPDFALKGISFTVEAGKHVGLVGFTGSGKSTTLSLIPRLYPITKGHIFIDDLDITHFHPKILRQQLGVVTQDVVIFQGTLRENLLGALSDSAECRDSEIMSACQKTGLIQFLTPPQRDSINQSLNEISPEVETWLSQTILDGGENLSMGERQLVAFTRMLIKNPKILILDEATASIDEATERMIQSATEELMHDRTCFIIAHRLSTVKNCDLILVFDQGKIVESGSHEELLARKGAYHRLVHLHRGFDHESLG